VTQSPSLDEDEATRFFALAAENLGRAGSAAGIQQSVVLSIIGVDQIAAAKTDAGTGYDGYLRAKYVHEEVTRDHAPGARVVRSAQFHDIARQAIGWGRNGDRSTVPDLVIQPVAVDAMVEVLLVATLAFDGPQLKEAKLGILSAALCALIITWLLFRATALLPRRARLQALLGTDEPLVDLYSEVDAERDHIRGPIESPVTVVEYGDFQCPYCGQAEPFVRELLREFGDVRYVWRHLPLNDVHPQAQLAAEAAEAAAEQDAFWEMHDLLLDHQDALRPADLLSYAARLGLDVERFSSQLREHEGANRVAEDVNSADLSGVSGTPTFFINGRRHYGAYDTATLAAAVRAAKARATVATS
jgi:protein-disulfide isomerase